MTGLRVQIGAVEPVIAVFLDADGEGVTGLSANVTIRRADGQFWQGAGYSPFVTNFPMTEVDAALRPGEYSVDFDTANADEGWHGIRATASASPPWPSGVQNPLQVGEIHVGEWAENVDATISSRADAATTNAGITNILNLDNANTTSVLNAISALNDPTAAAIADAVWDEIRTGHIAVGSYGELLEILRKLFTNRAVSDAGGTTVTVYENDGTTPAFTFSFPSPGLERSAIS